MSRITCYHAILLLTVFSNACGYCGAHMAPLIGWTSGIGCHTRKLKVTHQIE